MGLHRAMIWLRFSVVFFGKNPSVDVTDRREWQASTAPPFRTLATHSEIIRS